MNEYFVTVSIGHYQHLPETYRCFINAKSGEEAYEETRKRILKRAESWKNTSNELTGIELLDIRKL